MTDDLSPRSNAGTNAEGGAPACPLCRGTDARMIEQTSWDVIWRALEEYVGRPVPPEVRATATSGDVALLECTECGLLHSNPLQPGNGEFYAYLSGGTDYYDSQRWDFEVARDYVRPGTRVLDLGCGRGEFLRSLPDSVERVGVDINVDAFETTPGESIQLHSGRPTDFSRTDHGGFDLVCSFQVIEHVIDVGDIIQPATECLNDGGHLLLSVPNRDRTPMNEVPVLDWPPHHLSRWSTDQFAGIAQRFGLQLVATRIEERSGLPLVKAMAYQRAMSLLGRGTTAALPGLRAQRATTSGMRRKHTMLAVFQKPAGS